MAAPPSMRRLKMAGSTETDHCIWLIHARAVKAVKAVKLVRAKDRALREPLVSPTMASPLSPMREASKTSRQTKTLSRRRL